MSVMTNTQRQPSKVGDPCVKRMIDNHGKNYGCVGHVVIVDGKYRTPEGVLEVRKCFQCNRCGQAHGLVKDFEVLS